MQNTSPDPFFSPATPGSAGDRHPPDKYANADHLATWYSAAANSRL